MNSNNSKYNLPFGAWENVKTTHAHKSIEAMNKYMHNSTDLQSYYLNMEQKREYDEREYCRIRLPRKYSNLKMNPDGTISEK